MSYGLKLIEDLCSDYSLSQEVFSRYLTSKLRDGKTGMLSEAKAMQWAEEKYGKKFHSGLPKGDLLDEDGKIFIEVKSHGSVIRGGFLENIAIERAWRLGKIMNLKLNLVVGVVSNSQTVRFIEVKDARLASMLVQLDEYDQKLSTQARKIQREIIYGKGVVVPAETEGI
jgi:hypothetical protein